MKITKNTLERLIKEELEKVLNEGDLPPDCQKLRKAHPAEVTAYGDSYTAPGRPGPEDLANYPGAWLDVESESWWWCELGDPDKRQG